MGESTRGYIILADSHREMAVHRAILELRLGQMDGWHLKPTCNSFRISDRQNWAVLLLTMREMLAREAQSICSITVKPQSRGV